MRNTLIRLPRRHKEERWKGEPKRPRSAQVDGEFEVNGALYRKICHDGFIYDPPGHRTGSAEHVLEIGP